MTNVTLGKLCGQVHSATVYNLSGTIRQRKL
jgi:hypothetical protein